MFHIFQKSAQTGLVTFGYPQQPAQIPAQFRGAPAFDFSVWRDARPAAEVCPTGAIQIHDSAARRTVTVDYGLCNYCGECAEADTSGAVKITQNFELAVRKRGDLILTAEYALSPDGNSTYLGAPGPDFRTWDTSNLNQRDSEKLGAPGLDFETGEASNPTDAGAPGPVFGTWDTTTFNPSDSEH